MSRTNFLALLKLHGELYQSIGEIRSIAIVHYDVQKREAFKKDLAKLQGEVERVESQIISAYDGSWLSK